MDPKDLHDLGKESVFAVFDELRAKGINPTIAVAREHFTSSPYSVLARYLAEWNNQSPQLSMEKYPPPPDIVSQDLSRLWTRARLVSDEETERERLELGFQRRAFEKEKQDMLFEIQRLEIEARPQQALRDRFDAERSRLEEHLESLHHDLKEARLNQIDSIADKQRMERESLDFEQQQALLHKEIEDKSEEIETLSNQLKQQQQSTVTPEQIENLGNELEHLQAQLSQSQSELLDSRERESEQRSNREAWEHELLLERQRRKELEQDYNQVKLELDSTHRVEEPADPENTEKLENQIKALRSNESQYKKALADRQKRYATLLKYYEKLKQENKSLRASRGVHTQVSISPSDVSSLEKPEKRIEPLLYNPQANAPIDNAVAEKDGENILELAQRLTVLDDKKARGEQ